VSSPFEQCAVLEVTMARKVVGSFKNSSFKGAGKLLCVVDPHGFAYHFVLPGGVFMAPDEVNKILEGMRVVIRVDEKGNAYDPEEEDGRPQDAPVMRGSPDVRRPQVQHSDAGAAGRPSGNDSKDQDRLRVDVSHDQLHP
jgi:hypothetical protein